jgi:hypothetical protein
VGSHTHGFAGTTRFSVKSSPVASASPTAGPRMPARPSVRIHVAVSVIETRNRYPCARVTPVGVTPGDG